MEVWKGRKIDDNRYSIQENRLTRWIPPPVAVRIRKFRSLQEPLRLQDLLNSARSPAEQKNIYIYVGRDYSEMWRLGSFDHLNFPHLD